MSMTASEWFTEIYDKQTAFSVRYSRKLYERKSDFQNIRVFETDTLGRVLILDECFMVTEKDTFVYHEMLVHPAMAVLSSPRKALVIGGGDGGTITELVKYPELESIILCEIDPLVVGTCREYFPELSSGLNDPRVRVVNEDGAAFVKQFKGELDLVLVDSTDPVGPGVTLFELPFFTAIKESLKPGGAAVFQTESPLFMEKVFRNTVADLKSVFGARGATPYLAVIPSYPGALWSFTFCSETDHPIEQAPAASPEERARSLKYYNPQVHAAAFAYPTFVRSMIGM